MLNSTKTLKRYCKANLNVFLTKKTFDDKKNLTIGIDFLCQIEIVLFNMLKLLKISDFLF